MIPIGSFVVSKTKRAAIVWKECDPSSNLHDEIDSIRDIPTLVVGWWELGHYDSGTEYGYLRVLTSTGVVGLVYNSCVMVV